MAALEALARLVVEDPRPEHHVLGWFDTAVALRLADVGLTTIGKLVETINTVGYRWYRRVPRHGSPPRARSPQSCRSSASCCRRSWTARTPRTAIWSRTTAAPTTTARRSISGSRTTKTRIRASAIAPRPNGCCFGQFSSSARRCRASTPTMRAITSTASCPILNRPANGS
nr:phage integrase family protein [Burkholderia ubonensis]